jgi:hypothetical protein
MGEETDAAATTLPGSAQEVYAVQQEARLLRAKLAQREAVIIELNRRLRRLEQRHGQAESDGQGRPVGWDDRMGELQREIDALHATKTFRYTDGLRRFYGSVLRHGGR